MYKEKLRELLKEVPEVKEQMEKLEFGCKVNYLLSDGSTDIGIYCFKLGLKIFLTDSGLEVENSNILEIIGLPLQDRFLTMFLDNILGEFDSYNVDHKGVFLHIDDESIYIEKDNTKDLENQSEDFYKELYTALLELNGN